jgi:hypothetical protein
MKIGIGIGHDAKFRGYILVIVYITGNLKLTRLPSPIAIILMDYFLCVPDTRFYFDRFNVSDFTIPFVHSLPLSILNF